MGLAPAPPPILAGPPGGDEAGRDVGALVGESASLSAVAALADFAWAHDFEWHEKAVLDITTMPEDVVLPTVKEMREAASRGDPAGFASSLCEMLNISDPMDLLPLLRGTVAEVVRIIDQAGYAVGTRPADLEDGGRDTAAFLVAGENPGEQGTRRWRRTLQAMFNVDAATAMLHELLEEYRSEDFKDCARALNNSWAELPDVTLAEQNDDIDELCLRLVLGPVLLRYGFFPDSEGISDMKRVVLSLATASEEVRRLHTELQKHLYSCFSNIGIGCRGY